MRNRSSGDYGPSMLVCVHHETPEPCATLTPLPVSGDAGRLRIHMGDRFPALTQDDARSLRPRGPPPDPARHSCCQRPETSNPPVRVGAHMLHRSRRGRHRRHSRAPRAPLEAAGKPSGVEGVMKRCACPAGGPASPPPLLLLALLRCVADGGALFTDDEYKHRDRMCAANHARGGARTAAIYVIRSIDRGRAWKERRHASLASSLGIFPTNSLRAPSLPALRRLARPHTRGYRSYDPQLGFLPLPVFGSFLSWTGGLNHMPPSTDSHDSFDASIHPDRRASHRTPRRDCYYRAVGIALVANFFSRLASTDGQTGGRRGASGGAHEGKGALGSSMRVDWRLPRCGLIARKTLGVWVALSMG